MSKVFFYYLQYILNRRKQMMVFCTISLDIFCVNIRKKTITWWLDNVNLYDILLVCLKACPYRSIARLLSLWKEF